MRCTCEEDFQKTNTNLYQVHHELISYEHLLTSVDTEFVFKENWMRFVRSPADIPVKIIWRLEAKGDKAETCLVSSGYIVVMFMLLLAM